MQTHRIEMSKQVFGGLGLGLLTTHLNGGRLYVFLLIDVLDFLRHGLHSLRGVLHPLVRRLIEDDFLFVEEALDALLLEVVQPLQVVLLQEQLETVVPLHLQSCGIPIKWTHVRGRVTGEVG